METALIANTLALQTEKQALIDEGTRLREIQKAAVEVGNTQIPEYEALVNNIAANDAKIWRFNFDHKRGDLNNPLPSLPPQGKEISFITPPGKILCLNLDGHECLVNKDDNKERSKTERANLLIFRMSSDQFRHNTMTIPITILPGNSSTNSSLHSIEDIRRPFSINPSLQNSEIQQMRRTRVWTDDRLLKTALGIEQLKHPPKFGLTDFINIDFFTKELEISIAFQIAAQVYEIVLSNPELKNLFDPLIKKINNAPIFVSFSAKALTAELALYTFIGVMSNPKLDSETGTIIALDNSPAIHHLVNSIADEIAWNADQVKTTFLMTQSLGIVLKPLNNPQLNRNSDNYNNKNNNNNNSYYNQRHNYNNNNNNNNNNINNNNNNNNNSNRNNNNNNNNNHNRYTKKDPCFYKLCELLNYLNFSCNKNNCPYDHSNPDKKTATAFLRSSGPFEQFRNYNSHKNALMGKVNSSTKLTN